MTKFAWANEAILMVDRLWEANDYARGRTVLEDILYEEPGYAPAHNYAGWYAMYHLNDLKTAEMHFQYALKFDSTLAVVYIHYSELCFRTGNVKTLLRLINMSEKVEEVDTANLLNDLGRLHELTGNYPHAAQSYKSAVSHTMNSEAIDVILANRKRVVRKYRLFGAWYSWLL